MRPVLCGLRAVTLIGVLVGTLAACRVDATVTVDVADDGTGTVAVDVVADAAAVDALGSLDERVRTDDLLAAGWQIDGPTTEDTGVGRVTATKAFDHPDRLPVVLAEVLGPTAVSDVRLDRRREFAKTTWRLSGTIDLSGGLDLLADDDLAVALDGLPFARSDSELAELAGCPDGSCDPARSFSLTMVVAMPADGEGIPSVDPEDPPAEGRWVVVLGDVLPVQFAVESVLEDSTPKTWRTVSVIAGGLLLVVLAFQGLRLLWARRRASRPAKPSGRRRGRPETIREGPRPVTTTSGRQLRLVVLGGIGVVWDPGSDPEGLLVPFVREQGGVIDPSEVADRYRAASLGQLSSAEFWSAVGVPGDPVALDAAYLSRVRMRADVLPFLDQMDERGLPVACLTNAALPWSLQLRDRFGLDDRVDPWVASGEIGARKPSQAMFEALRRMSTVEYSDMLLIDSEPATLEAARALGMSTVLLRGKALVPEGFSHPVIDGFAGLFRPRRPDE
ncbi:MAG: HAD-IA family hydrolase [Actinomycetota bacterium]|nr:HAD-IA family hydrolase [Actinomycetota bacterium]MEC9395494.1 HAD-IA family hydrolase [Actinomycetota bacterium]